MSRDIFNYIKKPTIGFYRKEECIDKIYEIKTYNSNEIEEYITEDKELNIKKLLLNDANMNYKNEVLMAKIFFMEALNYRNMIRNDNNEEVNNNYEFLCKMYLENVIIKLFSSYDKTYFILNAIFDLHIDENFAKDKYKEQVREGIKKKNRKIGKKINSIFSRLQNKKYNYYRDDIIHNKSQSFFRIRNNYNIENKIVGVKGKEIDEISNIINEICYILEENKNLINELIEKEEI